MSRLKLEFPESIHFSYALDLRVGDMNYGQHLGHDTLVSLLHEARCRWLASANLTELSLDGGSVGWVVADLAVKYKGEAFYPDRLVMDLAVDELSRKGVTLYQRLTSQDGRLLAVAQVGLVFFDFAAREAVEPPEAFVRLLESRRCANVA